MNNTTRNSDILDTKGGIKVTIPGVNKKEVLTKLDAENFIGKNSEEIAKYIEKNLKIDLNTEEGIEKINSLYDQGLNRAREKRPNIAKRYSSKKFNSKEEIIKFCLDTNGNGKASKVNCFILKQIAIVEDIISNPEIQELKKKSIYVVEEILSKNIQIQAIEEGYSYKCFFSFHSPKGIPKVVDFIITVRGKDDESSKSKIARDPIYQSSTEVKDGIGLTFHTKNTEDYLLLMQYISQIIYYEEDILDCIGENNKITDCSLSLREHFEIENKNKLFSKELMEVSEKGLLNKGFQEYMFERAIEKDERNEEKIDGKRKEMLNKGTSKDYKDINITTRVGVPLVGDFDIKDPVLYPVGIEMKFVSFDEGNDDGLNFQPIYGLSKKVIEKIRTDFIDTKGYITESYLKNLIEDFFKNIDEEIIKKNKISLPSKQKTREGLLDEIWNDLIKNKSIKSKNKPKIERFLIKQLENGLLVHLIKDRGLIKVKLASSKNNKIYYTNSRGYNLGKAGIYPEMEKVK